MKSRLEFQGAGAGGGGWGGPRVTAYQVLFLFGVMKKFWNHRGDGGTTLQI